MCRVPVDLANSVKSVGVTGERVLKLKLHRLQFTLNKITWKERFHKELRESVLYYIYKLLLRTTVCKPSQLVRRHTYQGHLPKHLVRRQKSSRSL